MAAVRILLVDDETPVLEIARAMLGALGYHVLAADCATAALRVATENRVDLLLTDIEMPEMGGEELAVEFTLRFGARPVLFMSGKSQAPPGGYFIRKPFSVEGLDAAVSRALSGSVADQY